MDDSNRDQLGPEEDRLPRRRARSIPLPTPAALTAARTVEAEIRDAEVEIIVAFDATGHEILRKTGSADHVDLEPSEVRRLRHAVITHNHPQPDDVSFSLTDVRLAALARTSEVRVVTRRVTYSLRPPISGWSLDWAERFLAPIYEQGRRRATPAAVEQARRGEVTREVAQATIVHQAWVHVAAVLGLQYVLEEDDAE